MSDSGQELMRSWAPELEMWGPSLRGSLPSQFLTSHPIHATHPQKGKKSEMGVDRKREERRDTMGGGQGTGEAPGEGEDLGGGDEDHTWRAERQTTGCDHVQVS